MIVVITTRGREFTVRSLVGGAFGVPTPRVRHATYERMFGSWRVPRATYVFTDLERLAPWELQIAADLYRAMLAAGLRCLNDPARAMVRVELLEALEEAGINPFKAYRADSLPRPARFPVFVRAEFDHRQPLARLYHDQEQLDRALTDLRAAGTPLRGMLVIEHCAGPYEDKLWAKWGTWRIGERLVVEHLLVDDDWMVKTGDYRKATDRVAADEHDAVATNRYASHLRPAFDIAGIEYGRADHAMVDGRTVVYEINTNPFLSRFSPDPRPGRPPTVLLSRTRLAEALASIDTAEGGGVFLRSTPMRRWWRWRRPGFVTPIRP